jgi:HK97 family phage prohead protease
VPDFETRTIDVDVDSVHAEGNKLTGYAATFNELSEDLGGYRERIAPEAFDEVLATNPDVRLLVNHNPDNVLARTKSGTLRLAGDERGLAFEADLPNTTYARDLRESIKRGDLDGMSFRFKVAPDGETWDGDVRIVNRVSELVDGSVATYPAYKEPRVEARTRPNTDGPAGGRKEERTMQSRESGGLRVEDRTEDGGERTTLLDKFKGAGWEPRTRAEIGWTDFQNADEQRALTVAGTASKVSVVRRDGGPLGADRRYAFPVFPSVGVDSGTTSVDVFRQTDRTLPPAADVVRAIDAVTPKPEADSEVTVAPITLKQVAAIQKGIPNVYLEQDQIRNVVGQDLRLAVNSGLDKLVLDAIALADNLDPLTDPLLISIRKAITVIQDAGYNPDVLILTPQDAEDLDVLQTAGPEEMWVFGAGRFAPGELFGLRVRISNGAAAPVVADASAYGRLYVSPIGLQTFEENAGETNTSLVRMEGHAIFGVERLDAAVRIAAA